MSFPNTRLRRLRKNSALRKLVSEARISPENLVMPFFVIDGKNKKKQIKSMPGIFQFSIDNVVKEARKVFQLGVPAVLLFGVPDKKDNIGSYAFKDNGIVQKSIRAIKEKIPGLVVITDVCLCSYTGSGHCEIGDNDATLDVLARIALSHAKAGSDIVAPSAMMDGQVQIIRRTLDEAEYQDTAIMAYSAKYASSFYGPFRDAANSKPKYGNRKSYQMNYANTHEAVREVALDIEEGADIVMVKPALAYLDVITKIKNSFPVPVAAYNVSGEFSLVKAAASRGWIDEKKVVLEILTSIKRAGADIIITYYAKDIKKIIQ